MPSNDQITKSLQKHGFSATPAQRKALRDAMEWYGCGRRIVGGPNVDKAIREIGGALHKLEDAASIEAAQRRANMIAENDAIWNGWGR